MNRTLIWSLLLLSCLVVLALSALQSTWLRDQVLTRGLDAATESWSLGAVEGRLLTGLTLHDLRIEIEAAEIELNRLDLEPAFERLLWGKLSIRHLILTRPRVNLLPAVDAPEPTEGPLELDFSLPIPVQLQHVAVHELDILQDGAPLANDLSAAVRLNAFGSQVALDDFRLLWPDEQLRLSGGGTMRLTPELPLTVGLNITRHPASEREPPLHARINVDGNLRHLQGRVRLEQPTRGLLAFTLDLEDTAFTLQGDLDGLAWPDPALPATLHRLRVSADGDFDTVDWTVTGEGLWEQDQVSLSAHGQASPSSVRIDDAEFRYAQIQGDLTALLDLGSDPEFEASLNIHDLDIGQWFDDWPTRLQVSTTLRGSLPVDDAPLQIAVPRLLIRGEWNQVPARVNAVLAATVDGQDSNVTIEQLDLTAGQNHLTATGSLADRLDLKLAAQLSDLSQLWPGLRGAVTTDLNASGPRDTPTLELHGRAANAGYRELRLGSASWNGRLDLQPGTESLLQLQARDVRAGDLRLATDLTLTGSWPQLTLSGTTELPTLEMRIAQTLDFSVDTLDHARLQDLELQLPFVGNWTLTEALALQWDTETPFLDLSQSCLASEQGASLCWEDSRLHPENTLLDLQLSELDLALFAAQLPPELTVDGHIGMSLRVRGFDLDATLAGEAVSLAINDLELGEQIYDDTLETLELEFSHRNGQFLSELQAQAQGAGRIHWAGSLQTDLDDLMQTPAETLRDGVLAGNLHLAIEELAPFTPLIPGPTRAAGHLHGALQLSGTLEYPEVGGQAELAGELALLNLGLDLNPVRLQVSTSPGDRIQVEGSATIDGETLSLLGSVDRDPDTGFVADASVTGERIPLAFGPDMNLTLSPNLQFRYDDSGARLDGRAIIPQARIRVQALPEGGGDTLSSDVVIHRDDGEAVRDRVLPFWLNLEVVLGDQVRLSASGLETRLTGRLRLRQSPDFPLTAQGQLETRDGAFNAYGQDLTIRHGRMNFDGPLDNPAVDVLAIRRVEDAEVGIHVTGFADALETRLHSSPPRDEAEALTMLITGRKPGEASSADMDRVSDAALGYGLGQATPVIGRLVNQLGIDELALDSPLDQDTGAILVGTQVTDDIYVRYTYGLHTRVGGLLIEYRLTDWLSVQSETGTTQAIDLIFRREIR